MTPYAWTCLACEHAEPAAAGQCSRCGCPVLATAAQVDAARSGYRRRAGLPLPAPHGNPLEGVPWLPLGAAVFALLGGVMLVIALSVGTSASPAAIGGLLLALAAFCVSSYRPAAAPRAA